MRLTLDDLEQEGGEDFEPFELELTAGQVVSLPHPKDIPFSAIVEFDGSQPASVLKAVMGDDAFDSFCREKRVTLAMLEKILSAYYKHYGLGGPGEGVASSATSIGSARPSKQTSRKKASA